MQINQVLNLFKNSYILDPQILLWKTPYHMLFSAGSLQQLHNSEWFLCFELELN